MHCKNQFGFVQDLSGAAHSNDLPIVCVQFLKHIQIYKILQWRFLVKLAKTTIQNFHASCSTVDRRNNSTR